MESTTTVNPAEEPAQPVRRPALQLRQQPLSTGNAAPGPGSAPAAAPAGSPAEAPAAAQPWLLAGKDVRPAHRPLVGGKAHQLARLGTFGQPVPPWFVVTTEAFAAALAAPELAARVRARLADVRTAADVPAAAAEIQGWVQGLSLPLRQQAALREMQQHAIPSGAWVAVRSSAADEDGASQSFAGLHDSFLFLRSPAEVQGAIVRVWASAFNARALAYRLERGLPLTGIRMAVVVQQMIDAAVSGVMFTADPVTGSVQHVVISALYGAGEGLVSAGLDADTFTVHKPDLRHTAALAHKREQLVYDAVAGAGLRREPVLAGRAESPSLSGRQVQLLAQTAIAIENACGRPQDIEFALDAAGALFILQTRPVTTAAEYGPAAGRRLRWDNSNIIESYSGVTSAMTFSFIRRAYAIVYHCFAEVMGIPRGVVRANRLVFENMLGLFRGQVYYNLLNWYRLVRLFPGFQYNKAFMESMMGVQEPAELRSETPPPGAFRRYAIELPLLALLCVRSTVNFLFIRHWVARFEANFRQHYGRWTALDLDALKPHELMDVYNEMEDTLLWKWKAPIINDFYVMVFYGVLKKLCTRWCGDAAGALQNDLICGEGGIESTEPTRLLLNLAATAQKQPGLRDLIVSRPAAEAAASVQADDRFNTFRKDLKRYLDLYGFRCMNELKLEEYSLRDRPEFVYTILRNYLTLDSAALLDVAAMQAREQRIRLAAEERAFGALGALPYAKIKTALFRRVLRNARLGVKNRENMRFARTRIYGLLRELLRALGRAFAAEGLLPAAEDVFHLTLDECWDYVKGTAVTTDLSALAALRRKEFESYRAENDHLPDDCFDTYGMAYHRNLFKKARGADAPAASAPAVDGTLRGTGCCPGVVTGPVKVLRTPGDDLRLNGEILVADRTDPGWVPLYPSISGLLIERGSILSHSAIVAREMGIPTIVGIPHLTTALRSGQVVKLDGTSGIVEIASDIALSTRGV